MSHTTNEDPKEMMKYMGSSIHQNNPFQFQVYIKGGLSCEHEAPSFLLCN